MLAPRGLGRRRGGCNTDLLSPPRSEFLGSVGNGGVLDQQGRRAIFADVEVVLRKLGPKSGRPVVGRLVRAPRRGSVVVIEFPDGLHEYVTTPVRRILRLAGQEVYYLQTTNSRYRLEVRRSVAVPQENTFVR